ncbi:bifunctional riboflavin kinase/FAD synthetase [Ornithinibacillus salinisoli]|uniref:Riboflavin biosynthesis protein n=1 Tax=Ornithinibacillus salinisoli TaxID=1848459 RepID=A0ABW4VX92_9BACI
MRTIELTYPHSLLKGELPDTVAATGFFDGIHKGHQRVINTAIQHANNNDMESAVISFHPHPSVVLKKDNKHVKYITPMKEKIKVLSQMGVDRLYIITFNKELSALSPQEFIDHFIIGLNMKHVVAGFDFSYGHKGQGNMNSIEEHARGLFTHTTIDKVLDEGEKISSTRIRNLLQDGNVEKVHHLLDRPLTITGKVIEGEKRGRELGYPTANIQIDPDALLPKPGIYAVKIVYHNSIYEGMASLGINPTFTEDRLDLSFEVNIFDFQNDLYGEELTVQWYTFIREEEKFDSVKGLIDQIKEDERVIRNYFHVTDK